MSESKAERYNQLVNQRMNLENKLNRVPQLSVEEQSRMLSVEDKYSDENKRVVEQIRHQMSLVEEQMRRLF